jgi:hypothetical protein
LLSLIWLGLGYLSLSYLEFAHDALEQFE